MSDVPRRGVPVVISAPSGGGKTTLCHRVQAQLPGISFSISHTTRAPRGSEQDGVDYHFVDVPTFEGLVAGNAFLEWARVHGRLYGTSRAAATEQLARGTDVLFDIDVQGGDQIRTHLPDAVLVFIVPPSMQALEARLRRRQNNTEADIAARLTAAADEMRQAHFYTHWIVNDDLDEATQNLTSVLRSERIRRADRGALLARILGG